VELALRVKLRMKVQQHSIDIDTSKPDQLPGFNLKYTLVACY